jgi:glycosyltransferase involved in cell wall biosynthesis
MMDMRFFWSQISLLRANLWLTAALVQQAQSQECSPCLHTPFRLLETEDGVNEPGVMHIISDLKIGGGQAVVRTLVEYQAKQGCAPVVCTFQDGPLRYEIEHVGIPVRVLPQRRYSILVMPWFVADMVRIWHALKILIDQYHIDVVQTHLLQILDFVALLLRWTTPVRAVFWTFHSANFVLKKEHLTRHKWLLAPKRRVYRCLYTLAARWVDGFIAVSAQIRENLAQEFGPAVAARVVVIPNGVDVQRYDGERDRDTVRQSLGLPQAAQVLMMVGTLKSVKGHRFLLKALPALLSRHPNIYLVIVGDGELRDALHVQAAALNLEERVCFLGSRQDIADLLAAADLFVLPSLWEGLSMALLEAMATGLPIVASSVSGTAQALEPGVSGELVPPGDVNALAQALDKVLGDPAYARALGQAARQRVVAGFSAERQAEAHLALYRQVLHNKR